MISPEFLFFVALAVGAIAVCLHLDDMDEARRDARRRNPERTWDDES